VKNTQKGPFVAPVLPFVSHREETGKAIRDAGLARCSSCFSSFSIIVVRREIVLYIYTVCYHIYSTITVHREKKGNQGNTGTRKTLQVPK